MIPACLRTLHACAAPCHTLTAAPRDYTAHQFISTRMALAERAPRRPVASRGYKDPRPRGAGPVVAAGQPHTTAVHVTMPWHNCLSISA